jgi:hypothetical protein
MTQPVSAMVSTSPMKLRFFLSCEGTDDAPGVTLPSVFELHKSHVEEVPFKAS